MREQEPQHTARVSYVRAVIDYLEAMNIDAADVFGHERVEEITRVQGSDRLPISQWQTMLEQATQYLRDPALPLKLAESISLRHLGLVGFLAASCDTLGAAASMLERYELLLDNANYTAITVHDGVCELEWRPLISHPTPGHVLLALALWMRMGRWLTEQPGLACQAHFTFAAPADPGVLLQYQRAFGGPVCFDQPSNKLVIPASLLALPIAQHDPGVHELLREQAEADLIGLTAPGGSFLHQLEILLAERLEGGQITLMAIAKALDLSPRALQSRLDGYGVTYRELLERVRCRLAEQHLRNPALSLIEVALMLGFADQSSFHHAFKRWKGVSPGEFRRQLGGAGLR